MAELNLTVPTLKLPDGHEIPMVTAKLTFSMAEINLL